MNSEYTTVFDAGQQAIPLLPLLALALLPLLVLAVLYGARAMLGYAPQGLKLTLWGLYAFHALAVAFGYGSLWQERVAARDAPDAIVETGRLLDSQGRGSISGIFVDATQRFTVNGVTLVYKHRDLLAIGFLFPNFEVVALPLIHKAHVRITYRGEGDDRQLLRFEIASAHLN